MRDLHPATLVPSPPATVDWVQHHRTAIWRYLRLLGANEVEADDLVQETMLVGCRSPRPSEEAMDRAFLRGVARHQWLRSRRWWQRHREREIAAEVDALWLATMEPGAGQELLERLQQCLQQLQPRARQALDLHYRDGLGWRAVAAQLGQRLNGTKTLVQRARAALRTCIERRPR